MRSTLRVRGADVMRGKTTMRGSARARSIDTDGATQTAGERAAGAVERNANRTKTYDRHGRERKRNAGVNETAKYTRVLAGNTRRKGTHATQEHTSGKSKTP